MAFEGFELLIDVTLSECISVGFCDAQLVDDTQGRYLHFLRLAAHAFNQVTLSIALEEILDVLSASSL